MLPVSIVIAPRRPSIAPLTAGWFPASTIGKRIPRGCKWATSRASSRRPRAKSKRAAKRANSSYPMIPSGASSKPANPSANTSTG